MTLMQRRRALMAAKISENNGWKPGSYDSETTVMSVLDDGTWSISSAGPNRPNGIYVSFKLPVDIEIGDAVTVTWTKTSGTWTKGSPFFEIGGEEIGHKMVPSDAFTFSKTATEKQSANSAFVYWMNFVPNFSNYKATISITINGKQVI